MAARFRFAGVLGCVAALAAVLVGPLTSRAGRAAEPALSISPITAQFVQSEFATHYTVDLKGPAAEKISVSWTLKLTCIDPRCPDPNGTDTNPLPDVDPGCNNHGVGTTSPYNQELSPGKTAEFIWHHSDLDGCDHTKQGPRGHQGVITVVAGDLHTVCTATFKGTESSTPTSTTDGTASEPVCEENPIRAGLLHSLQVLDQDLTKLIDDYKSGVIGSNGPHDNEAHSQLADRVNKIRALKQKLVDEFFATSIYGVKFSEVFKQLDCVDWKLSTALGEDWWAHLPRETVASWLERAKVCKQTLESEFRSAKSASIRVTLPPRVKLPSKIGAQ